MQPQKTGETSTQSYIAPQASASTSSSQNNGTFIPAGQTGETSHSSLEKRNIKEAPQEDIYVRKIDSLLEGNPGNDEIVALYKEISQYLLEGDRAIPERDKTTGNFIKVFIHPQLYIAVKRLLSRYVEQRYQQFLDRRKKDPQKDWYKKKEWQDWFKTVTTEEDVNAFNTSSHNLAEMQFSALGFVDAWSSILREHIFNQDQLLQDHFRKHVMVTTVVPYYSVVPYRIDGWGINYVTKKHFHPEKMMLQKQSHIPKYSKETKDQSELFHIFTGTHHLKNESDDLQISGDGSSIFIPAFPDISQEKQDEKIDILMLTDKNKVAPTFFNTKISLPPSPGINGILAILQPEIKQLWIFPRSRDDKSLSEKVRYKMGALNSETCNIIYFSLEPFATELSELGEVTDFFLNIPQFQVITPFRYLIKNTDLAPENGRFSFSNYELLHDSFSKPLSIPMSLEFQSIHQSFQFTAHYGSGYSSRNQTKKYEDLLEWRKSDSRQVATNSLMRFALSFLLDSFNNFQCQITHSKPDELKNATFDKNGFIFENEAIREWIRRQGQQATHPVTKQPISTDDLYHNHFMHKQWLMMRAICLKHDLSNVKMPQLSDLQSPSTAPEMPSVARKALEEYQGKMSGLSKTLEQQMTSFQRQAQACENELKKSLDECFGSSSSTKSEIKKKKTTLSPPPSGEAEAPPKRMKLSNE